MNDRRARLILNACYSGCSDVRHNSMNFMGIAQSLVSPYQEVLGHLWFVHDLASATLGVFTLDYILKGIGIHENLLFSYQKFPAIVEAPVLPKKLATSEILFTSALIFCFFDILSHSIFNDLTN